MSNHMLDLRFQPVILVPLAHFSVSMKKSSLHKLPTFIPVPYGTVTVGAKGQTVIPQEVRRKLKIQTGDQLLVFIKLGRAMGLVKATDMKELHDAIAQEMKQLGM